MHLSVKILFWLFSFTFYTFNMLLFKYLHLFIYLFDVVLVTRPILAIYYTYNYPMHSILFPHTAYESSLRPGMSASQPYQGPSTPAAPTQQSYESLGPDATASQPYQALSTSSASAQPRYYDSNIAPPASAPPANDSTYREPSNEPTYIEIEE